MILEAIDHDGSFIDIGCANGYPLESLDRWLQGAGIRMEFSGLEISEALLDLASRRLPQWRDRLILGPDTAERGQHAMEEMISGWGHEPTGYCEKSHQRHPQLCRRLLWYDN